MSAPTTPDEAQLQALLAAARAAREQAYAPYSHFKVGAAVLDLQGRIHAGCNVENAAYPQGLCAEANALAHMVMAGGRQVQAVVVVGDAPEPVTPCGGCRQKIREFAGEGAVVIAADLEKVRGGMCWGNCCLLASGRGIWGEAKRFEGGRAQLVGLKMED